MRLEVLVSRGHLTICQYFLDRSFAIQVKRVSIMSRVTRAIRLPEFVRYGWGVPRLSFARPSCHFVKADDQSRPKWPADYVLQRHIATAPAH